MLKREAENPSTRTKVLFSRRPQWMLPESQAEPTAWGREMLKEGNRKTAELSQVEGRKREVSPASRKA